MNSDDRQFSHISVGISEHFNFRGTGLDPMRQSGFGTSRAASAAALDYGKCIYRAITQAARYCAICAASENLSSNTKTINVGSLIVFLLDSALYYEVL